MTIQPSGTRNGEDWPARGSVIDLPDAEALDYINAGMAVAVATFPAEVETATAPKVDEQRDDEPRAMTRRRAGSALTKTVDPAPDPAG